MTIMLAGSRTLSEEFFPHVLSLVNAASTRGEIFAICDAKGADMMFARAAAAINHPFCLYGTGESIPAGFPRPQGFVPGNTRIPFPGRLAARTRSAASVSNSGIIIVNHPNSKGSLNTAAHFIAAAKPLMLFSTFGDSPAAATGCAGYWAPMGRAYNLFAWKWQPAVSNYTKGSK